MDSLEKADLNHIVFLFRFVAQFLLEITLAERSVISYFVLNKYSLLDDNSSLLVFAGLGICLIIDFKWLKVSLMWKGIWFPLWNGLYVLVRLKVAYQKLTILDLDDFIICSFSFFHSLFVHLFLALFSPCQSSTLLWRNCLHLLRALDLKSWVYRNIHEINYNWMDL